MGAENFNQIFCLFNFEFEPETEVFSILMALIMIDKEQHRTIEQTKLLPIGSAIRRGIEMWRFENVISFPSFKEYLVKYVLIIQKYDTAKLWNV